MTSAALAVSSVDAQAIAGERGSVALRSGPSIAAAAAEHQNATPAKNALRDIVMDESVRCTKPKSKFINLSWGIGENHKSTTVYFNNHCSVRTEVKLYFRTKRRFQGPKRWTRCLTTNGGTKGRKKYHHATRTRLLSIMQGC
ncbi:hypothetical protein [Spongiactinospora rosea]|uniref:hypothetical protein n=1 Tax=Spongiactinospora rosea TaxID=2248750 RepID=UPI0011C048AC|nr:hypothetical protein [Spongiactinospora rosea]